MMTINIFIYYLKKTFYHPERNNMFPSYRMKAFSRHAILQLWNMEHFKVGDKTYTNSEIRYMLSKRMLPRSFYREGLNNSKRQFEMYVSDSNSDKM